MSAVGRGIELVRYSTHTSRHHLLAGTRPNLPGDLAYKVYVSHHHYSSFAQLLMRSSFANLATRYQVLVMLVTIWLAEWSRQTFEEQQRTRYLTVLVLLTLAAIIVSLLRAVITFASLVTVGGYTRNAWCMGWSVLVLSI